jgi:putative membrane protein
MSDFLLNYYLWLKAFHIIAFVAWMAGLLYLPRLFIYHLQSRKGGRASKLFVLMEKRLLRLIMNPAMIAVFLTGLLMIYANPNLLASGWLHAKWALVAGLVLCHMLFAKWRKDIIADRHNRSQNFYRVWNEVPTALMIGIVILAIVKPF